MYAIALTSIPPRFARLAPVLAGLLAQEPRPARVFLCLPRRYRRFPGPVTPPALPPGVTLLRCDDDPGPAGKALITARHLAGQADRLIYCDDDWIMQPGWAAALLAAGGPGMAVTGQTWSIARLGRRGATNGADIAQGYSGVLVDPRWLAGPDMDPPDPAWPVDDVWLSGHLARQGIGLADAPAARRGMIPAHDDAHALQKAVVGGMTRDGANRACAALLHDRYGIWPPLS